MGKFCTNLENLSEYEIAKRRVNKIKKFYTALFIYAIGASFFIAKEYANIKFNFFPLKYINSFVMVLWTLILVVKGIRLFVTESLLGNNWENQKIKQFMEQDQQRTNKWN